jgi:hypothetical protein
MLFHHRAEIGCLAWIRTKTVGVKTQHIAVLLHREAVVARRGKVVPVQRIKSPLHRFNACRPEIWLPEPKIGRAKVGAQHCKSGVKC